MKGNESKKGKDFKGEDDGVRGRHENAQRKSRPERACAVRNRATLRTNAGTDNGTRGKRRSRASRSSTGIRQHPSLTVDEDIPTEVSSSRDHVFAMAKRLHLTPDWIGCAHDRVDRS